MHREEREVKSAGGILVDSPRSESEQSDCEQELENSESMESDWCVQEVAWPLVGRHVDLNFNPDDFSKIQGQRFVNLKETAKLH